MTQVNVKTMGAIYYSTMQEAVSAAIELNQVEGILVGIWQVGPRVYILDAYRKGDETRQGYVTKVGQR